MDREPVSLKTHREHASRQQMLDTLDALRAEVEAGIVTGCIIITTDPRNRRRIVAAGTYAKNDDAVLASLELAKRAY